MPEQLKKCPFCGGDDAQTQWRDVFYVRCPACGAEGETNLEEDQATADWNSRPLEDALQKRVQELEEEAEDARLEAKEEYPD